MMAQMTAAAARTRTVNGKLMSIADLGYSDIGLDDNWQSCGHRGPNQYTYHDPATGAPIVNLGPFPDMKAMTTYAHSLGLTAGWYGNNCSESARQPVGLSLITAYHHHARVDRRPIPPLPRSVCSDKCSTDACYEGDVNVTIAYGFDSTKLDGASVFSCACFGGFRQRCLLRPTCFTSRGHDRLSQGAAPRGICRSGGTFSRPRVQIS